MKDINSNGQDVSEATKLKEVINKMGVRAMKKNFLIKINVAGDGGIQRACQLGQVHPCIGKCVGKEGE